MTSKANLSILTISLALSLATAALAEKKKIAIGDPKTKWAETGACQGYTPDYADTVSRSLRSRIVETGAFRVVSRDQMKKILREHEMAMTGLSDPSNAKILGQFLQADLILATEVLCHSNFVEFVLLLIDVESAEIVWTKTYKMKDLKKVDRALQDIAKLLEKYAKTGSIGDSAGKSEQLMMVDSKALHDASTRIIATIENQIPNVTATVDEVNAYAETVKVKVRGQRTWPGLRLKVMRDDAEVGWLYLKKTGSGDVEAGTQNELSSFEEGDVASSADFKPKVAIGYIEDEDEDNEKMVEMFKEGLLKEMSQAERLEPVDDRSVEKILERMGKQTAKKDLEKLFQKGVDLLIVGRFSGEAGNRRIDFDILSTFDGKRVTKVKVDSRL